MTYPDVRPSVSSPSGTAANAASQSVDANKTTESNSQTDLDSLRRQVTDLQNAMAKLISDAGNVAVKSAKEATSGIADKSSEMAQAASEQAKTFASELEKVARANPLGALAGALLVGVVIGLIGRSRS